MCDSESSCRITRIVNGDHHDVQLAQLQMVMQRIQDSLCNVASAERIYLGNALLNLAVNRILCEQGSQHTATLLMRLSDAMSTHSLSSVTESTAAMSELHG